MNVAASHKPSDHIWMAAAFASINACMLGGMSLFAKLLGQYLGPIEVTFFRNAFSLIALVAWMIAGRHFFILKTERPWAQIFRGFVGTLGVTLGMWAVSMLSLAQTTVLLFTSPLFTVLLSIFVLKEKVGLHRLSAVFVGFMGIIVIANPFNGALSIPLLGLIAGISWGFCSGSVDTILRWLGTTEKSTTTTFYFMLFGVLTTGLHLPFADLHEVTFSWNVIGIIAGLGLCGLFSLLAKSQSFRLGKASIVAPMMYTMIIWSVLFDYLFWDQVPSWNVVLGAFMIIGSNLFILHREHKHKQSK